MDKKLMKEVSEELQSSNLSEYEEEKLLQLKKELKNTAERIEFLIKVLKVADEKGYTIRRDENFLHYGDTSHNLREHLQKLDRKLLNETKGLKEFIEQEIKIKAEE